jgi:hypothetical protein
MRNSLIWFGFRKQRAAGTIMTNEPVPRRQLPTVVLGIWAVIWALMCAVMALSVVVGFLCMVVGTLSLFVERLALQMILGGAPVKTTGQKAIFIGVGATLCGVGIGFWWLRQRGYVAWAVVLYAAIAVLALVIAWTTGSSDLLSISWEGN